MWPVCPLKWPVPTAWRLSCSGSSAIQWPTAFVFFNLIRSNSISTGHVPFFLPFAISEGNLQWAYVDDGHIWAQIVDFLRNYHKKSASGKSIDAVTFHQSWLLASFETNWWLNRHWFRGIYYGWTSGPAFIFLPTIMVTLIFNTNIQDRYDA